jgi:acetyltransferase-like isoleucine patch superfamily enzyme
MISELANIYGETNIGEDTKIGAFSDIGNCTIGKRCNIQTMVSIPRGTIIGDDVFIGPQVTICNDKYPPSKLVSPVIIKDHASIGGNVTILPGVTIGEYAIIGAGSVVTKNVPNSEVWYGNPAKRKIEQF